MRRSGKKSDPAGGIAVLLLVLITLFWARSLPGDPGAEEGACGAPLFLEIDGDLPCPGVYAFCGPVTLEELAGKAGATLPGECLRHFPGPLPPGTRMVVTGGGDNFRVSREEISGFRKLVLGIPLSLNRETREGLTAVAGIGPVLAETIVKEREVRGGFKTLEEIMELKGVGRGLFRKICPYLAL